MTWLSANYCCDLGQNDGHVCSVDNTAVAKIAGGDTWNDAAVNFVGPVSRANA